MENKFQINPKKLKFKKKKMMIMKKNHNNKKILKFINNLMIQI